VPIALDARDLVRRGRRLYGRYRAGDCPATPHDEGGADDVFPRGNARVEECEPADAAKRSSSRNADSASDESILGRFRESAEQAAKNLGIDLRIVDYENREEKQIDTLQGLIASGINGLIVVPHNTQMGPAILDMAGRNNIPVTVADRWPGVGPESDKYIGFVGSNDEKAGYDIASELLRQGCTKIVVNNGLRGHSGYQARTRGRTKATSEHPEVKVLREEWASSVRAEGTKMMEAWLTALPGPEFDCLYGGNDDWAMGAWKVLSDRGVATKVKIAGLDLIPEVVEKLQQGTFAVSAGGHWYEGALSVVQMYDFLHGIKPAQPITLVTDIVVTKNNAAKFEDQFIKNPMEIDWKQRSRVFNEEAPSGFVVELRH
jgi:ABC-type sugar transport system substrate-binding protein